MPTEDELFNLILERYDTYELLELTGLSLRELLTVWDGWVAHPAIMEDLGFDSLEEEDDDDQD